MSYINKEMGTQGQDDVNWIDGYRIRFITAENIQSVPSNRK
jgi:hypothetical protein